MSDTDSDSEYEGQITVILDRVEQPKTVDVPQVVSRRHAFANLHYTRPCQNAEKGVQCQTPFCTFAHTVAQLRILPCRDGERCRFKRTTCRFIHDSETKQAYFGRTGYRPNLPEN
jgi:hypothetical protein